MLRNNETLDTATIPKMWPVGGLSESVKKASRSNSFRIAARTFAQTWVPTRFTDCTKRTPTWSLKEVRTVFGITQSPSSWQSLQLYWCLLLFSLPTTVLCKLRCCPCSSRRVRHEVSWSSMWCHILRSVRLRNWLVRFLMQYDGRLRVKDRELQHLHFSR